VDLVLDELFQLGVDKLPLAALLTTRELEVEAGGDESLVDLHEPILLHELN